jgi:hypothetical protein
MTETREHFIFSRGPRDAMVCFSVDSARPDTYLNEVERELFAQGFCGEIIFDLLAANGNTSRRFLRIVFDGKRLHWLKAKALRVDSIEKETFSFCQRFYAENVDVLNKSVMSTDARHRFLDQVYALA